LHQRRHHTLELLIIIYYPHDAFAQWRAAGCGLQGANSERATMQGMLPIRGDKKATDARTAGNRILRSEHTAMSAMGHSRPGRS
jgi:hypothetical protein